MGVRQQRLQDAPCSSMGGGCQSNKYEDRQSRQLQRIKCTKWRDVMHWVVLSSALLLGTGVYPSEAFATSFVPRTGTFVPRGGSSASSTSPQRDTMECVLQSHSPKTDDSATTSNEQSKSKQPPNTATPSFVAAPAKNTDLDGSYDQDPTAPLRSSSTKENRNAIFHHNSDNDTESSSSSSGAKKFVGPILKDVAMPEARVGCAYVAETNLPTDVGHFRLRAYRLTSPSPNPQFTGTEPCVIYCTDKPPFGKNGFPVRIHDQCFTSEVFRSRRCDCKEQLKMSLEYIQKHGGAIIYLQQEGRGIGLANKIAAYEMQDGGMDTVEANIHLGFPEDCRQYGVVPGILADMGIDSIQLITNNPRKVNRLRGLGIDVVNTIPMVVKEANQYNRKYLETKVNRMNHTNFGDLLAASPSSTLSPADIAKANGSLSPEEKTVAENYITEGEEMAAVAIRTALMANDTQTGVAAAENGYCFGRESVEDAVAAIKRGELVVVVDDESRENEGDFIMAADLATPETMATMIRYTSGVICIGMEGARMDELKLPPMLTNNEDPKGTAFSVTVDATTKHGITTGISATDRAKTLNLLGGPESVITADDFVRPGHIFPLRAREGGVLTRDGHTEASVDLSRLAGRHPSGVLCEIVSEEHPTEMARLPELKRFCKRHGFVLTSIVDIAQYRRDTDQ